jgi:hypothetical protein
LNIRTEFARRLIRPRPLVIKPGRDTDERLVSDDVAPDEAGVGQIPEQAVHVQVVVRENLNLEPFRPVLQPPFAIRDAPEPFVTEPMPRREIG